MYINADSWGGPCLFSKLTNDEPGEYNTNLSADTVQQLPQSRQHVIIL